MDIILWIIQGLLTVFFLMIGVTKARQPKDDLLDTFPWVEDVSGSNVKLLGISQILAGLGLILPQVTGILPWLTPLAALGLAVTMIGAVVLHIRRNEVVPTVITGVILLLCAFVAYGRFVLIPA
jgi:uncharacterized membrane protein